MTLKTRPARDTAPQGEFSHEMLFQERSRAHASPVRLSLGWLECRTTSPPLHLVQTSLGEVCSKDPQDSFREGCSPTGRVLARDAFSEAVAGSRKPCPSKFGVGALSNHIATVALSPKFARRGLCEGPSRLVPKGVQPHRASPGTRCCFRSGRGLTQALSD